MDLLKSVLGLGQNIGNFFSKKKKDLEDTIQTFIPKQTQAPAISPPKLSTPKIQQQKPTVPQPTPTPVSMPNLSFNQPKQASQPQSNPLADFFKNTATKATQAAGNAANAVGTFINKPYEDIGTLIAKYKSTLPQNEQTGVSAGVKALPEVSRIVANNVYKNIPGLNQVIQFVGNRVVVPAATVPAETLRAKESSDKGDKLGAVGHGAMAGLNALYTAGNIINPAATQFGGAGKAFLGWDALKSLIQKTRSKEDTSFFTPVMEGITGKNQVPLGTAVTDNPTAQKVINTAEMIGSLLYPAMEGLSKRKPQLRMSDFVDEAQKKVPTFKAVIPEDVIQKTDEIAQQVAKDGYLSQENTPFIRDVLKKYSNLTDNEIKSPDGLSVMRELGKVVDVSNFFHSKFQIAESSIKIPEETKLPGEQVKKPYEASTIKTKPAQQIQQEVQNGTYQPRTKRVPTTQEMVLEGSGATRKPVTKQRGFVESVQGAETIGAETKQGVKGSYKVQTNDKLMGEAKVLMTEGATINFKGVKDVDQKIAATMQEALNLDKSGNPEAAAALYNNLAEHGTELGRGVQAYSLLKKMSPQAIALSAAGKIKQYNATHDAKIPELTGEQVKEIGDMVTRMDGLTGRAKNIAMNELKNKINSYIPSSLVDKAVTVWKAGLLTSLRTHERNLFGNTIMQGTEMAKDIPATFVDKLLALRTGKRTLTPTMQGTVEGGKKGVQAAKDIVTMGFDPEETISKFDVKQINWGNNPVEKALKKYTDAVFRTLGGADKPFWNASFARSLYDQAGAEAINAGKQGDQAFIQALIDKPTEAMLKTATKDANYATFHDKNVVSNVAGSIKRELSKTELGHLAGEVLMPFTGVPSSIVEKTVAYSPIGLVKGIAKAGKVAIENLPDMQREAAQEVGRGVMGTGLFAIGAYLTSKGLMTGQPKDAKESALWQAQGKQANSVLIGGKWRSINSIGPQSLILLAGAKYNEDMQGKDGGLGKFAFDIGKDQLNQTFLAGVQQPIAAINDPARYGKSYFGNQAATIVPNIVKDLSKSLDPTARETNTIGDYMQASIPLARNFLLPKRDVLGSEVPQEPTGVGAFFDLFNSKTPKDSAVLSELDRLYQGGNDAIPSKMTPKQTIQKQKMELTFQQLDQLEKGVGEALKPQLESLIQSDTYQQMTDEAKTKAIDNLVTDVRTKYKNLNAEAIMAGTTPETSGVKPAEAKTKAGIGSYSYVDAQGNYKEINIGKVADMPEKTRYEKTLKQKAAFAIVDDIMDNLPQEQQAGALKAIGMDEKSATYYNVARQTDDAKTAYLMDRIDLMSTRKEMLDMLVEGRSEINGKMITTNSVIDDLYNSGIISKAESTQLKKIKLNSSGQPTRQTSSGSGGLTKSKMETMVNKAKAFGKQFAIGEPPEIDTTIPKTKRNTAQPIKTQGSTLGADFFKTNVKIPTAQTPNIQELIQATKAKMSQSNIDKAKELIAKARQGGGGGSAKLSRSFFRGR